jgi:hypothetical protein
MALISDEIGKPWTEMYKHGVRGLWGALGKYNAVGSTVGGIVDITGDFNTYSGIDLGIAVGIDIFKTAMTAIYGAATPFPAIIISGGADYAAYLLKKSYLLTDKDKQDSEEGRK